MMFVFSPVMDVVNPTKIQIHVLFIWGVFKTRFKEEGFPRFKGSDWFARVLYITKCVWLLYLSMTQNDYHRVVKTLQLKFANSYNIYIYIYTRTYIYIHTRTYIYI